MFETNNLLKERFPALAQSSITGGSHSGATALGQLAAIRLCSPFKVGADPVYYCTGRRPIAAMHAERAHHERENFIQERIPRLIVDIAQMAHSLDEMICCVRRVRVRVTRGKHGLPQGVAALVRESAGDVGPMVPQVDSIVVLRLQAEAKGWKPVTLDQIAGKDNPCGDGDTGEFARSTLVSLKVCVPGGGSAMNSWGKKRADLQHSAPQWRRGRHGSSIMPTWAMIVTTRRPGGGQTALVLRERRLRSEYCLTDTPCDGGDAAQSQRR